MIEICKKCPKTIGFLLKSSRRDTIIVNCQLSIVNSAKPLNIAIVFYHPKSVIIFRYPLHMQPGVEKGFQGGADEKQHRGAGGGNGLRLPGVGALLPDIEPEMPV